MDLKKARREYSAQKANAKQRGIPWRMTFKEWVNIWLESGWYHRRGCHRWEFVMCRKGDKGPYSPGNVEIRPSQSNIKEGVLTTNRKRGNRQILNPTHDREQYDYEELQYWEEWGQYLS